MIAADCAFIYCTMPASQITCYFYVDWSRRTPLQSSLSDASIDSINFEWNDNNWNTVACHSVSSMRPLLTSIQNSSNNSSINRASIMLIGLLVSLAHPFSSLLSSLCSWNGYHCENTNQKRLPRRLNLPSIYLYTIYKSLFLFAFDIQWSDWISRPSFIHAMVVPISTSNDIMVVHRLFCNSFFATRHCHWNPESIWSFVFFVVAESSMLRKATQFLRKYQNCLYFYYWKTKQYHKRHKTGNKGKKFDKFECLVISPMSNEICWQRDSVI